MAVSHLVAYGKGRALAFVLTGGQVADTTMLPDTIDEIRVAAVGLAATLHWVQTFSNTA